LTAAAEPLALTEARTGSVAGFELNVDTITATVVAGLIVIAAGLYARRGLSAARPTRAQLAWETLVSAVERTLGPGVGASARRAVPLTIALFAFVLTAGLIEIIPSGHPHKALPAPTGDLNLTLALAAFTIAAVHATAIKTRGMRGYLRHYLHPTPWLLPLKLLEELTKPVTLALRLFGNMFAGTIMVVLIFELIPTPIAPLPLAAWKLFSVFVAGMQAFIFAGLTVLYFDTAVTDHDPQPQPSPAPVGTVTTGDTRP
jgi:F-type H+-transporting ATPase subunit a